MPAIQSLKKQLRGIRSTQKLTKAMRTISTVKFSKLNGIYANYSEYGKHCKTLFDRYGAEFIKTFEETNSEAPTLVMIFASNKGLCGNFNAEILNFAKEKLSGIDKFLLVTCSAKAASYFRAKNIPVEKEYDLKDIPSYDECAAVFDEITQWRKDGKVSNVLIIYPEYKNIMMQTPTCVEPFSLHESNDDENLAFVPDKESMTASAARTVLRASFYKIVLESSLGAQAATLTTMRSAYDTATEYCAKLEGEINRMRQSAVTADVIETSAERKE